MKRKCEREQLIITMHMTMTVLKSKRGERGTYRRATRVLIMEYRQEKIYEFLSRLSCFLFVCFFLERNFSLLCMLSIVAEIDSSWIRNKKLCTGQSYVKICVIKLHGNEANIKEEKIELFIHRKR